MWAGREPKCENRPSPNDGKALYAGCRVRASRLATRPASAAGRRPRVPGLGEICATVVVPAVLILTGADITTAALGAGAVAAVTASIFVVVRMTGLSLPQLGTSGAADAPTHPQPEPPEPAWAPEPRPGPSSFSGPRSNPGRRRPLARHGTSRGTWTGTTSTHGFLTVRRGRGREPSTTEPHLCRTWATCRRNHPGPPPAEPIGPALGLYPNEDDGRLPWEHDQGFAEKLYHPPEPWLPEPRVDESELHPAEQRGRHRRGP